MKKILVTGSTGQLGQCLQKIALSYPNFEFVFKSSKQLDITNEDQVKKEFEFNEYDYCINCAAYTNVEQAEQTPTIAFKVNADGVKNIAHSCKEKEVILIHISTDYVFDGEKNGAYTITDIPNPINEYGKSKLLGERYIQEILNSFYIIRTSWLYSEFGKNFYTTILEKSKTEKVLRITDEQQGCPTKAENLAIHIIKKISINSTNWGIEHFTDGMVYTWYGFAETIIIGHKLEDTVQLVRDKKYRTFVKRPINSVLE